MVINNNKGFIMSKEISNLTIRIETDLKKRFGVATKANDSDISKELRKYIKKYLSENEQIKMEF